MGESSQVYNEYEEPRKIRKKKKEKIRALPNKVVVIKNAEKDGGWMENWDYPKRRFRSPGHLIHPFKLLALGGTGRGKTNCIKKISVGSQIQETLYHKMFGGEP